MLRPRVLGGGKGSGVIPIVQRLSHKIIHFFKKSTKLFMRILLRALSGGST